MTSSNEAAVLSVEQPAPTRGRAGPVGRPRIGATPTRVRPLRRATRMPADIPVAIVRPSGDVPARIIDISEAGVGLAGEHLGIDGDRIRLRLPDGRQLDGEIRWHGARRCGVSLDRPLTLDDPLMRGAANQSAPPTQAPPHPLPARMLERALRKQGVSWLLGDAGPVASTGAPSDRAAARPSGQELKRQLSVMSTLSSDVCDGGHAEAAAARQRLRREAVRLIEMLDED